MIAAGLINFVIFSFGMGILMEQRYLKDNRADKQRKHK